MRPLRLWPAPSAALLFAALLTACGGGGGGSTSGMAPAPAPTVVMPPGAPALSGNTALDGFNWFNYRRGQIGLSVLTRNSNIDAAAQGHSNYQFLNSTVTHEQVMGLPGFTGATLRDRLAAAGYVLPGTGFAYAEVISAASDRSGFYHAEELIAAIYHRFVIFEPVFREMGTGAASGNNNYTYFTADFATVSGYGAGLGRNGLATYPASAQTMVPLNFMSDSESPDPVPNLNEVGYPVSVHADIDNLLTVQNFSMRARGGSDLAVRLMLPSSDVHTPKSAAAIIPLAPLRSNTIYDVSFQGTVGGMAVSRNWSFTTR
ncbi:CAP domain-containing protein [Massilia sp. YIM B04103]|uniref:CAP domain-containing protein n=1 Tax=Massilia sp. YIM B04103 TaxID=2963106 RepID=UPI00210A32FB|nr:CAP domain-containing protein [Massilia sp. YIM B04103]